MLKYLQKSLICLLIIVIPYMNSASKAMDNEDYEGSVVRIRKVSLVTEDQQDVQFSTKQSASFQALRLDDSQTSLVSYLSSSVTNVAQKAYDIVDYATRNPSKSMILGLCLSYQVTTTLACFCFCYNSDNKVFPLGSMDNKAACTEACETYGGWINYCFGKEL